MAHLKGTNPDPQYPWKPFPPSVIRSTGWSCQTIQQTTKPRTKAGGASLTIRQRTHYGRMSANVLRILADWWRNELDDDDRYGWWIASGACYQHRDYVWDITGKAFVAFALANFAFVLYGWGVHNDKDVGEGPYVDAISVHSIDTANQLVEMEITYGGPFVEDPKTVTWLYQIDPIRTASTRRLRFTRYITGFNEREVGVYTYYFGGDCPWHFASGDELFFCIRNQRGFYFQECLVRSGIAP